MVPLSVSSMRSRELLDAVLAHASDPEVASLLQRIVSERTREDQWLDFEHAKQLAKPAPQRSTDLRKKLAGFANADGGVLLVGIEEYSGHRGFVSCAKAFKSLPPSPAGGWASWAHQVLDGVFAQASRLPIARVVPVSPRRSVLVVAVSPSDRVVWVRAGGELTAYVRVGEHTSPMPQWMHADLVLGRRRHPVLDVACVRYDCSQNDEGIHATFQLRLTNTSLVWLSDFHTGLIAELRKGAQQSPSADGGGAHWWYELRSLDHLQAHVSAAADPAMQTVHGSEVYGLILSKTNAASKTIPPLGSIDIAVRVQLASPQWNAGRHCVRAVMALYVVPQGSFPQWWRVSARIAVSQTPTRVRLLDGDPLIERVDGTRHIEVGNRWISP